MKKYEYKEISLGGVSIQSEENRAPILESMGLDGWELVSMVPIIHHPGSQHIELKGFFKRENKPTLIKGNE